MVTSSPVSSRLARRPLPPALDLDFGRRGIAAVGLPVGLVHHHALGVLAGERFIEGDVAGGLHGAGEEARIEQMQDRVLDAADILIDRHQAIHDRARGRRVLVPGIGEAREIPRRIHEGVHGVGVAQRFAAALRAGDVLPGRMMVERVARLCRTSRPPAAPPADPCPAPAPRRIWSNGSPESGSPNSAAAKCPSRAGGNLPCARRPARCRASLPPAASRPLPSPASMVMPSRKRELIMRPSPS